MKTMEELAITIGELLDETCETRFRRLIECKDGWGGRDEKAMRLDSANEFVNFISLYVSKYSLDASDVGIFFNDEGYVSTSWHAKNSSDLIDITFTDGIIGVYTNGFEIESVISDELLKTIFEY
jgi:hypothetical protein